MVYLGTSGYSYQDWVGNFYPPGTPSAQFLDYYARHFPTVEVNYTYYRMPNARTLAAMARKTPPNFLFAVKATSLITHERQATDETFAEFRRALQPLIAQDKLACVLAQFPHSFHNNETNRAYLGQLRAGLAELPVVVEFRNIEWIRAEVFDLLRELDLGFCCVDQPRFKNLVPPVAVATSDIAYLRFHGRNYEKWWQHDEAWERYDYLYSRKELTKWVEKVKNLSAQTETVLAFFNNHYQAQAVQNAQLFTDMLSEAGVEVARAE